MSDESNSNDRTSIYRVMLRGGATRDVEVTKIDDDYYSAKGVDWSSEGVFSDDPLAAVAKVAAEPHHRDPEFRYGWPVREIVEPGQLSRDEALAEAAANVASLGRWLSRSITPDDALTYAVQHILINASSAPNCWAIEGTAKIEGVERRARVSVQWVDGKNPHELLYDAMASRDALARDMERLAERHKVELHEAQMHAAEVVRAMWIEDLEGIAEAAAETKSPGLNKLAEAMRDRVAKLKAAKFDVVRVERPNEG